MTVRTLFLYLWFARLLLLLQLAARGTLVNLNEEHAHCNYIVAGVASRQKHVDE